MSLIAVVAVEGVLTELDRSIPTASPQMHALQLVEAIAQQWQIGFIYSSPVEKHVVEHWLREIKAPSWAWLVPATRFDRADVVLRTLGARRDRGRWVIAGDAEGFDKFAAAGITTMLMSHASTFAMGDWRPKTTWKGNDDDDTDLVQRSRGSTAP